MTIELKVERLREVLNYDPSSGVFVWKAGYPKRKEGEVAGRIHPTLGYRLICIDSKQYTASKIVWLYMYGVWPREVDHIDGDRANDVLSNLREVSRNQNCWNAGLSRRNASGVKGVCFDKCRGKWFAYIRVYGKMHSLGRYSELGEAVEARRKAERRLHGEFARAA